jgi:xanthine dehydrogenase molybdenum-binding subunit
LAENAKYKLIGQNYVLPDMVAKVTGRAKYSEDFRADGTLFAKLLLSGTTFSGARRQHLA